MFRRFQVALAAGVTTAALVLSACGSSSASSDELTLYNAQHEDLMKLMVDGFTKKTGIKVKMRNGGDFELGNQLVQEGSATPADVFTTENSPAMSLVANEGDLSRVDSGTLTQVPSQFSPSDGNWIGFAARSTVFAYNSNLLKAPELPVSIMDLAKPEWKGEIGIAPTGADFQAIVSAVAQIKGDAATAEWLTALKANAKVYQGNTAVMKAVDTGEIRGGIIYHYYWFKDRAESGANSTNTELHYFGKQDPGAFVSVSGAGILKASKKQAQAQQFLNYLTSAEGQKILADSNALEYVVASNQPSNPKLKPLDTLEAPAVDPSSLNGPKVEEMMRKAGLL